MRRNAVAVDVRKDQQPFCGKPETANAERMMQRNPQEDDSPPSRSLHYPNSVLTAVLCCVGSAPEGDDLIPRGAQTHLRRRQCGLSFFGSIEHGRYRRSNPYLPSESSHRSRWLRWRTGFTSVPVTEEVHHGTSTGEVHAVRKTDGVTVGVPDLRIHLGGTVGRNLCRGDGKCAMNLNLDRKPRRPFSRYEHEVVVLPSITTKICCCRQIRSLFTAHCGKPAPSPLIWLAVKLKTLFLSEQRRPWLSASAG